MPNLNLHTNPTPKSKPKSKPPDPHTRKPNQPSHKETNPTHANANAPNTNDGIIPRDPTIPLNPQPLIAALLRTRYCVPGSIFLVEAVERSIPVPDLDERECGVAAGLDGDGGGNGNRDDGEREKARGGRRRRRHRMRTVRLLLGDGELCIQAFVRGGFHWLVDRGSVGVGCYVRVEGAVEVREIEVQLEDGSGRGEVVDDGAGDPAGLERERAARKARSGRVVYLVVGDMVTVGWNEEYIEMLRREEAGREKKREMEKTAVGHGVDPFGQGNEGTGIVRTAEHGTKHDVDMEGEEEYGGDEVVQQLLAKEEEVEQAMAAEPHRTETRPSQSPKAGPSKHPPKGPEEDNIDYISDSDSAFETLAISAERAQQRRVATAPDPLEELQTAIIKQNKDRTQNQKHNQPQHLHPAPAPAAAPPKFRPWLPTTATRPVKLTPLASIPHLPYRQNWMINVLAIVTYLSDVEPSHIGPSYRQRTARLADASVPPPHRPIHLTVYLDPEGFTPREGEAVLLLGVKNHLFEGGSVRKYVSDGLRGGEGWWVQSGLEALGWCREEVGRLRAWWEGVKGKYEGGRDEG